MSIIISDACTINIIHDACWIIIDGATRLNITTFSITTRSIMTITIIVNKRWHNVQHWCADCPVMLSVIYAECLVQSELFCWMSFCWMSFCWMLFCWMSLCLIDNSRVAICIVASLTDNSRGIIFNWNMFIVQATDGRVLDFIIEGPRFRSVLRPGKEETM